MSRRMLVASGVKGIAKNVCVDAKTRRDACTNSARAAMPFFLLSRQFIDVINTNRLLILGFNQVPLNGKEFGPTS